MRVDGADGVSIGMKSGGKARRVILGWTLVVLVLAIAIGLRLLFAGGDWGCIADANPGLCSSIRGEEP